VAHAKAWAEQSGVPVSGFRELKVPDDVLRDVLRAAGFDVPTGRRGRGGASSAGRQRAKAVPVDEIKNYVLAQTGTFLLADIMGGIGGSQATVRTEALRCPATVLGRTRARRAAIARGEDSIDGSTTTVTSMEGTGTTPSSAAGGDGELYSGDQDMLLG